MESKLTLIDRFINNRLLTHIMFWMLMSVMFYVFFTWFIFESFLVYAVNLIAILPPQILLSYLIIYFLIPSFLYKKKYVSFALLLILSIYISTCLSRFLTIYIVEDINHRGFEKESIWQILTQINHLISRYFFVVVLGPLIIVPLKLIKDRFNEREQIEALKKEKANAELNFLKAQIHPHFLFNTLNNLYMLTLDKSDEAPDIVLKLSEMLDYMLYQCNGDRVELSKEVELLENYIDLEKLRYGDRLALRFEQKISDQNAKIAPLLLISLVENAFKHGVSGDPGIPKIEIEISEIAGKLSFRVYNTKPNAQQDDPSAYKDGIGLKNFKSQLELQYKNRYELTHNESENDYETIIEIEL